MKRIAEKDLRINCREFERQASRESLGFLLSETTIGNFASHSLCGWAADNTLVHGQSTDVSRKEHGRSVYTARTFCGQSTDRARTFCVHSTDVLHTQHGHFAARARTFCVHSTDVLRPEHGQSTDVLRTEHGHSVACCAAIHQIHNRVTRHLSNLCKLLVMCTV